MHTSQQQGAPQADPAVAAPRAEYTDSAIEPSGALVALGMDVAPGARR